MLAATVPTLSWLDVLVRLALAGGLGAMIGFERELREREAGLRTHLLVGLGSGLFTIISAYGFHEFLPSSARIRRASRPRSSRGSASSAPARSSARACRSAG